MRGDCQAWRNEIEESAAGAALSGGALAHLSACARCRVTHDESEKLGRLLSDLERIGPPPDSTSACAHAWRAAGVAGARYSHGGLTLSASPRRPASSPSARSHSCAPRSPALRRRLTFRRPERRRRRKPPPAYQESESAARNTLHRLSRQARRAGRPRSRPRHRPDAASPRRRPLPSGTRAGRRAGGASAARPSSVPSARRSGLLRGRVKSRPQSSGFRWQSLWVTPTSLYGFCSATRAGLCALCPRAPSVSVRSR
jgi:hypothetical protein